MNKLLKIIFLALLIAGGCYYAAVKYFAPGYIAQMLPAVEQLSQQYVNGSVKIGGVQWDGGLSAQISDVTVLDGEGHKAAEIPLTKISVRPWLALQNPARALAAVELVRPQVYLAMDDEGKWNLQHFLKPSDSEETPFYGVLKIDGGVLHIALPEGSWQFDVAGSVSGGANPDFAVDIDVRAGNEKISLQGLVTLKGVGNIDIKTDKLSLEQYAAAVKRYLPVESLGGAAENVRLRYENDGKQVQFSGTGKLSNLGGSVSTGGEQHTFAVSGEFKAAANKLNAAGLEILLDGQKIAAEGNFDLSDIENIEGEALVSAEELRWQDARVSGVKLPVRLVQKKILLNAGEFAYGGGTALFNAWYDWDGQTFAADASLKNINQVLFDGADDTAVLNGDVALNGALKDGTITVSAAADTFDLKWRGLEVNKFNVDADFDGQKLVVAHASAFAGPGNLTVSGVVEASGALAMRGAMTAFPVQPFLAAAGQSGRGLCSTGFELGGTLSAPAFSGVVKLQQVEFMQQQIDEAHGLLTLKDNVLTISDFIANMRQGRHSVSGSIDLNGEPQADLQIISSGVRAEPLAAAASLSLKVTGNVDNIINVRGTLAHPFIAGELRLTDGSAEGYLIDKIDGTYQYDDGRLTLHDFDIRALSTQVVLNGVMTKDQRLDFTMDASDVELEKLPVSDKDVELRGSIDAYGRLTGTLAQPYFSGDVSSDELKINGVVISEFKGTLSSNGRETNQLAATFKQPYGENGDYGLFDADINVNIPQRFVQGKVVTAWGNLANMLKLCRQNYDIDGTVQGEIDINPAGKGSGIDIAIYADDVRVHDLNYHQMRFKGRLAKNVLYFNDVKLTEQKDVEDRGVLTVGGQINLMSHDLDLEMSSVKANPAIATALMQEPPEIKGELDMLLQLRGTLENPVGSCSLEITNGSVSGVGVDKVTALLELKNDNIHLHQLLAVKDVYDVKADGDIPLDLFRSADERRNPNAQMRINMDLDNARLGILPAITPLAEWAAGDTEGKITLGGTLEEPLINGYLKISDGSLKVKYLDTVIDKINTDIEFKGNNIQLHDLSAQLGKGTVKMDGSYALRTRAQDVYKLHLVADNAELASEIFTGRVNSEINIVPQSYRVFDPERANNAPPETAYRPAITGRVQLDNVLVNMPTIPELGEGSSNFGFDLQVDLGKNIHFFNKYLYDMWLSGNMHINGSTNYPIVEGKIKADRGSVTYLRTPFKLRAASVSWILPGTFLPNVNLESEARFSRYDIFMRINGPVETMDLKLVSNPPLSQNTIIRMLTLQRDTAGGEDITSEDMQNLLTAGLQMSVLGDVEMLVKQTLGLDQFRIYTGKVRSGIGFENVKDKGQELTPDERNQYNILVSKYLNDRFMLGYTRSFDGVASSVFGQYDISRHLNVTYSRSYDLAKDAENWYGVEYKVTF